MTGGQTTLSLGGHSNDLSADSEIIRPRKVNADVSKLKVIRATNDEITLHEKRLSAINEISGGSCLWLK